MQFSDRQLRDIGMWRMFNHTYDEIAAKLREEYGLDASGRTVGRTVRAMEATAREGYARDLFNDVVTSGYRADILGFDEDLRR